MSLSPDVQTISVSNFINNSGGGPANITQNFTERVKEYFQQNSTLKIYQPDGTADLLLEGAITGYDVTPIAPTEGQFAALNRLTVRVQVKFTNTKDETQNFDSPFSFYADFDQSRTLTSVENELLTVIFDQIVLDIFNKSVANW
ncbi:LptE family protein [Rhodocytophaga aerolata]|uniref:LptE family protein n=1 Tax=Rhodocytophaga aerolata TaxID=455078 RepID=UPI00366F7DC0